MLLSIDEIVKRDAYMSQVGESFIVNGSFNPILILSKSRFDSLTNKEKSQEEEWNITK